MQQHVKGYSKNCILGFIFTLRDSNFWQNLSVLISIIVEVKIHIIHVYIQSDQLLVVRIDKYVILRLYWTQSAYQGKNYNTLIYIAQKQMTL